MEPKKLLVVASHMDDESLSCGGLIRARLKKGWKVHVLVLCGRVYDYGSVSEDDCFEEQADYFVEALTALNDLDNFCTYELCNMREGEPYAVGYYPLLEKIEGVLSLFHPDEVVIPSAYDLNQDHRHHHNVCKVALRPGNIGNVKRVLSMVAFDSELREHTYYLPLKDEELEAKLTAIRCYVTEVKEHPHPRSEGNMIAWHRLMGSKVGEQYAEAFDVVMIKE